MKQRKKIAVGNSMIKSGKNPLKQLSLVALKTLSNIIPTGWPLHNIGIAVE